MSDWFEGVIGICLLYVQRQSVPPSVIYLQPSWITKGPCTSLVEWSLKLTWNREWRMVRVLRHMSRSESLFRPFRMTHARWRLIIFEIGSPVSSRFSSRNPGYFRLRAAIFPTRNAPQISSLAPSTRLEYPWKLKDRPSIIKPWPWQFLFVKTREEEMRTRRGDQ